MHNPRELNLSDLIYTVFLKYAGKECSFARSVKVHRNS